jgi:hypothetical protein
VTGHVFLHLRKVPSGRWVATPVLFCELTRDGDTAGEAERRALDTARDRIGDLGGVFRVDLSNPAVGELEEIVLTSRRIRP